MDPQSTSYHQRAVQSVPVQLNPQLQLLFNRPLPQLPLNELNYRAPTNAAQIFDYDFKLEKKVVADYEARQQEQQQREQLRIEQQLAQERAKLKKVAPGYTPTQNPLQPMPAASKQSTTTGSKPASSSATPSSSLPLSPEERQQQQKLNYLEFEQGLPPPNPWDTHDTDDDISQLAQVLSGTGVNPPVRKSSTGVPALPPRQSNEHNPPPSQSTGSNTLSSRLSNATNTIMQKLPPLPAQLASPLSKVIQKASSLTGAESKPKTRIPDDFSAPMRQIFLSLVDLGFPADASELGVRLYANENDAVDFCISRRKLTEQGFAIVDIDSAYNLLAIDPKDPSKPALKPSNPTFGIYLKAMSQLREFGYQKVDIRRALLSTRANGPLEQWSDRAIESLLNNAQS